MSEGKNYSRIGSVIAASAVGSLIEYYDFFIAASAAALVWPTIMFPKTDPAAVFLASTFLFVATPITRPVGAYIFGHFGDKLGRKFSLVFTLVLMGIAALGIGLVPPYATIGLVAPIIIAILRIIQGIGLGGEIGNATLMILEYVHSSRWRAFWTSFVHVAGWLGVLTSSLFFALLASNLSQSDFLDWGWRIPFYVGAAVILVGIYLRYRIAETPLFMEILKRREVLQRPANEAFKKYWKVILPAALSWVYTSVVVYYATSISPRLVASLGLSPGFASLTITMGAAVAVFTALLGGYLGDVVGRRTMVLAGAIVTAVYTYPYFLLLTTGNPIIVAIAQIIFLAFTHIGFGSVPAYLSERFPTALRSSGTGLAYQLGPFFAGAIVTPIIGYISGLGALTQVWPYMAIAIIISAIVSILAIIPVREVRLEETQRIERGEGKR
ncbi:MAG: MFS transporter [Sulfolobaceae archaeon]